MDRNVIVKVEERPDSGDPSFLFFCPGCQEHHGVWVSQLNGQTRAQWTWNGSMTKPTFSPSILIRGTRQITDDEHKQIMAGMKVNIRDYVCHSFVTDGRIQFCGDSTHSLAGQTVDLAPVPE